MHENSGNKVMPPIVHRSTVHASVGTRTLRKERDTLAQANYRVALIASHSQHGIIDRIGFISVPRHASRLSQLVLSAWSAFGLARRLDAVLDHFPAPKLLPVGILLELASQGTVIVGADEVHSKQLASRGWLRPLPRLPVGLAGQAAGQALRRVNELDAARTSATARRVAAALRWDESAWQTAAAYGESLS